MTKKKFYIIDGASYIYRAFFAVATLSNSKGLPTNAVYGFTRMFMKMLKDESPDYVAVAFDSKGKTFRHEEYCDYKANRPKMPEALVPQIPYIKKFLEALNISVIRLEGFEADDLIGTMVKKGEMNDLQVTIVSGDKDMMQLISPDTRMLDTMKGKSFGVEEVIEKFGVEPDRVVEVMGLMGDSSDNIPGVPGVGQKRAMELISEFGDIENLIKNADKIKQKSIREKIQANTDMARLCKRLVTINTQVPVDISFEKFLAREPDKEQLLRFFNEMEFTTLIKDFDLNRGEKAKGKYNIVHEIDKVSELVERIKKNGSFAIDTETTGINPMLGKIVGISLSLEEGEAFYIPVKHEYPGMPQQLTLNETLAVLAPVLESHEIRKYGQNIKYDTIILSNAGINLRGISFDTMVASYLINPSSNTHNLGAIAREFLNIEATEYKDVVGKKNGFWEVPIETASDYSCEDADLTFRLTRKLEPILKNDGLYDLFEQVEIPLIEVLIDIEMAGVNIDKEMLKKMSMELEIELARLKREIHSEADEEFNINSPKQLGDILFNKLKLKSTKKTKTGYSTNVKVLEKLALKHPLPAKVLEYRQFMKLKSTYVDSLPKMINPQTGRIHTSYNQSVTATGRLSSSDPNLQNIPIRTEIGRKIRRAFIAEPGNLLLSADYSQIELRILAHLSEDVTLTDAFHKGEDVHERTALEIFGALPGTVTSDMRRMAKTVNFGIVYGISAFGLSEGLGVPRKEAAKFIENYFERYNGVREYTKRTVKEAMEKGYVTTLLNRRRYLPDLKSSNRQVREFAERTAVNTPVQGSAADIIKLVMINIRRKLRNRKLQSKIIMQVHDELVFEVPEKEKETLEEIVREQMEGVMSLSVPLVVDIHSGKNWDEAH